MTRPCVLAALLAAGEMDKDEWAAASRVVKNKLAALEAKLAAAQKVTAATPAAALAGREDAAELWAKLDLEAKRAVIRSLVTVTIGRQRRGVRRPCVCPRPGRSRSRDRGTCGPRAALAPGALQSLREFCDAALGGLDGFPLAVQLRLSGPELGAQAIPGCLPALVL